MGFVGFLILLLVAVVLLVVFAAQNSEAVTVSLFQYHWHGVPLWLPVAIGAGLVVVLFFIYLLISGTSSALERGRLRSRIRELEGRIRDREGDAERERDGRLDDRGREPVRDDRVSEERATTADDRRAEGPADARDFRTVDDSAPVRPGDDDPQAR